MIMLDLTKTLLNNLYKFTFISGSLIVVIFLFIPEYMEYKWMERSIEIKKELNLLEYRLSIYKIKSDFDYADQDMFSIKEIKNAKSDLELRNLLHKYKEIGVSRSKEIQGIKKVNDDLEADYELQKYIQNNIDRAHEFRFFGVSVGISLSFFGLLGWFFRVQVPLDRKLKNSIVLADKIRD